jgi:hypothetical protein
MDQATLDQLLRDAQMLARFALRQGKLPAGSRIFDLIGTLSTAPQLADAGATVAELYAEMDRLTKAINPDQLKHWAWQQATLSWVRRFVAGISPFALGFLTLLLTFYLAFQSSQLHQADTALRAYDEWVAQQPKEKLYTAFKMYRYERVLNVTEPPLAQLDAYQKLVEDAHQLASKGAAIQDLLQNASQLLHVPPVLERLGLRKFVETVNVGDEVNPANYNNLPPAADSSKRMPDCKSEFMHAAVKQPKRAAQPISFGDIEAYENSWTCFLIRLRIDEAKLAYSPWPVIYETRSKVNMLVTWLLPGLYGLLGACVYVMRDMMLSRRDRTGPDQSVFHQLTLLLRIALGGLAGIIIGWFWVPGTVGGGAAAPAISSIPFGIAFLAGFSIETLFSLLDRINRTIENRDQKKP